MGRKKKKTTANATRKNLIFCYYCGRKFKTEKELIAHQRAIHFKCPTCHKRFNSARGLQIHCFTVHKEAIQDVPGVPDFMESRSNFDVEILGMQGVPPEAVVEALQEDGLLDQAHALKMSMPNQQGLKHGQVTQFPPTFPGGMPGFGAPMGMFQPHMPPPTNPMLLAPQPPQFQPQFTGPNALQPPRAPAMPQPPTRPPQVAVSNIAAPPAVTLAAQAQQAQAPAPPAKKKAVNRIYDIEDESMEERRAALNKYRFNANLMSDVSRLEASISSRLHNVQGGSHFSHY